MTRNRRIGWSTLIFLLSGLAGPILMALHGYPPLLGRSIFDSFVDALGPSEITTGHQEPGLELMLHLAWLGFLGYLAGLLAWSKILLLLLYGLFVGLCASYFSFRAYAYGEQPDTELTGFWLAMAAYSIPFLLAALLAIANPLSVLPRETDRRS